MLIGNYNVLQKSCGRFTSGSSLSDDRGAWGKNGALRGRYVGWAGLDAKSALPDGYQPSYAWSWAKSSGGMSCRMTASSSMSGSGAMGLNAQADLTGTGDITNALATLIVSASADLTGSGTISNANLLATLAASANLTGSGDVTAASLTALGWASAGLTGTGTTNATLTGIGELSADITVTGDLLSTANVGDAVWQTLIEAGYDASRVLRIIAAATAGKSSSGPDTPIFRNLGDTEDMISGTADGNGNRTAATYGA